ncbi:hypothetical protein [Sinorhizobium meliloti]|uniref:hypothetical protein n=1 Tax=Rhizobium meliloti TaxID=382 RepID=UPI000FDAA3B5|nr:hypothetical protein [Sinorhizobium meliloti]RVG88666.1 hypothetical protein CN219_03600 [Sinorhizobium meliloti]RVI39052.1 hypothetical protein CN197_02635 [Sinorhizobium meliloti]RVI46687.1 hypothetical protein CN196_09485 [Sinorhizobium meliloti]RVJ25689.1 hypothetical protein CN177_13525 [Sinorhizobium meliloti]RVK02232.1 hypothetical protein CN170_08605 [Sinorhizobium meliloti]
MTFFAFFIPLVMAAYWVGRDKAGYGIALFLAGVLVWQVAIDGPASLLESNGCADYGHAAKDC